LLLAIILAISQLNYFERAKINGMLDQYTGFQTPFGSQMQQICEESQRAKCMCIVIGQH
jgi:hypothetical protein